MSADVIDLFAGAGGFSVGARLAGCRLVWAGDHWPEAVEWHRRNHPDAEHVCQDLHQANWEQVPRHDIMLASPCCQGHSRARGTNRLHHDASRSTAWAIVSAAEFHRPPVIVVENVPEFQGWLLYRPWSIAMRALGYAIAPHVIDAADHGAPQHRTRLFLVLTRSAAPIRLNLRKRDHLPARLFIDVAGNWHPIHKPGRAAATLERIRHGRRHFGERFLISYYGNTKTARSIDRPIGTITTRDRWAVVHGDRMRMLTRHECRAAMSFPDNYQLPDNHRLAVHLMGNAVCPRPAAHLISAIQEAA